MKIVAHLSILLTFITFCSHADKKSDKKTILTGTLTTGMMAIGGETTGTLLKLASGESYELSSETPEKLAPFSGKKVRVEGSLTTVRGVERGLRRILIVDTIEEEK